MSEPDDPSHPSPEESTPKFVIERAELFDGLRPRGKRYSPPLTPPPAPDPTFFDLFVWNGGDRLL